MSTMEQVEVGKYQPYPEYKDSGVEWLGLVPKHWNVCGFKRHILRNDGGVWGDEPSGVDDTMVLRSTEQTVDGRWIIEQPAFRQLSQSEKVSALLIENDLVITKSSGSANHIGKTTLVTSKLAALQCCYSNFMQRVRTHSSFLPKLAWYVMNNRIAREQFNVASNSTIGLANLNGGMIGQLMVVVPSIAEQQTIVAFLDYETARIDQLIAQQQRLIELLKEKRQAVISHAVTKGLNPDAPMKDSGVEWLGEVPEHWVVTSIKHLVSHPIIDGPHVSPTKHDEGVPFISAEALAGGYINFDKKWGYISPEEHAIFSKRYSPRRGDILMVKLGATTGICAMVETDEDFNIWVPLAVIRPKDSINSKFMLYLMKSDSVRNDIQISWTYGTQQTLGLATIANICVTMPSYDEQVEIVHHIEETIPVFENSITAAAKLESLLTERRTALISAAVTGKIDLRGWTAPTLEAAV